MKKQAKSPFISCSNLKPQPIAVQQPEPVQVLQQKLHKLEQKYSNFVERCSKLFRFEKISNKAKDFISGSSQFNYSSHSPIPNSSIQDTQQLLHILTKLEKGTMIKEVMSTVSEAFELSQDKFFKLFNFPVKLQSKIKESYKDLTAEIWNSLLRYENFVQLAVKNSIKKIKDLGKAYKDNLIKSENNRIATKDKYKQCNSEKILMTNKFRETSDIRKENSRMKSPEFFYNGTSTQQNLILSRSAVSSPVPYRGTPHKVLGLTSEFKLSTLPSRFGTESSLKYKKLEFYEVEKKEIQSQLRCLQTKLENLEKIARNLIHSSKKSEHNIMEKNQESNEKLKVILNNSQDESIEGSHISILEVDIAQKSIEIIEKENLLSSYNTEKVANNQLTLSLIEKDENFKELAYRVQELESELEMSQERCFCMQKKLEYSENLLTELKTKLENVMLEKENIDKTVQSLKESKKLFNEKIKEKDISINDLNAKIDTYKNFFALIEKQQSSQV